MRRIRKNSETQQPSSCEKNVEDGDSVWDIPLARTIDKVIIAWKRFEMEVVEGFGEADRNFGLKAVESC